MNGPAPIQAGSDGKYPVPQPGITTKREFADVVTVGSDSETGSNRRFADRVYACRLPLRSTTTSSSWLCWGWFSR